MDLVANVGSVTSTDTDSELVLRHLYHEIRWLQFPKFSDLNFDQDQFNALLRVFWET